MAPPLIQLKDIKLSFGGTPLLSGVELSVSSGERVCLIGRNGSGKSTLLKIAAGTLEPDSGSRFVQPGATIRYLPQEPDFAGFATVLAYVEAGLGPGDDRYQARYVLEQLGLHCDEEPGQLSGVEYRGAAGNANLAAAEAEKSGKLVIEARNIGKSYGDRKIVEGFSIRVQRGDRIGIVGPNGAGKTTLIDMLTGGKPPDSGTIRFGANIEMATLDQHRESLDPKSTLAEALTGGRGDHVIVGGKPKHVVSYMKDFLFAQEQMRTPLEVLSGGERGRLMLARALAKPSNVLVLDEPTNDLDLETLDVLEEMIGDYAGTVLLISHDRDFLDRVVNDVIVPEGGGKWLEYAGGYSDMLAQRGAELNREPVKVAAMEQPREAKPRAEPTAPKRRLNFNEKHALETLPKLISELHAEIASQQRRLDDPDLFHKDRQIFDQASDALTKAQRDLREAEDKWLELEMLREEIEQA